MRTITQATRKAARRRDGISVRSDAGMSTAEYADGTVAAAGHGGILIKMAKGFEGEGVDGEELLVMLIDPRHLLHP